MELVKASELLKKSFDDFNHFYLNNKDILHKKDKQAPLLLKVFKDIDLKLFKQILDMGFIYDFTVPDTKMSFLQTLIVNEELDKATLLVAKYPLKNIDFVHKATKQTALMMAGYMNHTRLGQALLFKGADPTLRDINGLTALQIVRLNKNKH